MSVAGTDDSTSQRLARLEREFGPFDVTSEETVVSRSMYTDCLRAAERGTLGGARAFVRRTEDVLLVQYDNQPEVWELPGGATRRGEQLSETATERVRYETGIRCTPTAVVEVHRQEFVLVEGGNPVTGLWVFFETDESEGGLAPSEDVADARWFAPDDLPDAVAPEISRRFADD